MERRRAGEHADAAGPRAVGPHRGHGGLFHGRVTKQAEVVVAGEHQHAATADRNARARATLEWLLVRVEVLVIAPPQEIEPPARGGEVEQAAGRGGRMAAVGEVAFERIVWHTAGGGWPDGRRLEREGSHSAQSAATAEPFAAARPACAFHRGTR